MSPLFVEIIQNPTDMKYPFITERKGKFLQEFGTDGRGGGDSRLDTQDGFFCGMKKMNRRLAFMDLMLYYHLIEKSLTEKEICEEVDNFMFAGHDTTGWALIWT